MTTVRLTELERKMLLELQDASSLGIWLTQSQVLRIALRQMYERRKK